ncbi:PREDICTED: monoacylglycerol lipase ABHD12-like [Priapulus caudatus]|uniref:Monoacylglycerol lipase ABHD12-like n=1 Tax=Priapulus caudatus TaxID=37621 RepID=A0ABM1F922_PRICU|nr:PREDICTED: monoacylglycerol lipase ABHD12-like [Priapulus caudatus]
MVAWPPFIDLSMPELHGLPAACAFYLESEPGVTLGVWHILPKNLAKESKPSEDYCELLLGDSQPVILYLHGNAGTRAGYHRVQIYKMLSDLNFHVIALDYRGFGDSTGSPTEKGISDDAMYIYRWLEERADESKIIIWGHSLGTGVATQLTKQICDSGGCPARLVLEAPITSIMEVASEHPLSMPYKYLPFFTPIFLDAIAKHGASFNNTENIASVRCPTIILHAKDDPIVPFKFGEKLFQAAEKSRHSESEPVHFVAFEDGRGYYHKHLHLAPELPAIIEKFVKDGGYVRR